jgi:hypothetical protein
MTACPSSILAHPLWERLRPYFKIENCRGEGGRSGSRFRIELEKLPPLLYGEALGIVVACCSCGRPVQPIRSRTLPGNKRADAIGHGLYYACACPLSVRYGCSRGHAAREEYQRIKSAIEAAYAAHGEQFALSLGAP